MSAIAADVFYREIGLEALDLGYVYALRSRGSSGASSSAVFFGDARLFTSDRVLGEVAVPGDVWQVALRPARGWQASPRSLQRLLYLAFALALCAIGFLLVRQIRTERELDRSRARASALNADYRSIFDGTNDAIIVADANTLRIEDVNARALDHFGLARDQLLNMRVHDFHVTEQSPPIAQIRAEVERSGSAVFTACHRRSDGQFLPVEISTRMVGGPSGTRLISIVRDISERQRSAHALRRSQQDLINAIDALSDGFVLWDQNDRLQIFNRRAIELMPVLDQTLRVGMSFDDLLRMLIANGVVAADEDTEEWMVRRTAQHRAPRGPIEFRTRAGRIVKITEFRTPDGYTVGLYTDVTEIRAAEEHVHYRAYFDVLTELPNRENFMAQLENAVRQSQRDGSAFALLFIGLDRFKNVNDTLGHTLGDHLLREAAHRLANCVRQSDTLARFGGDEFTLILRGMEDGLNAAQCAETIIDRLSEPYRLAGHVAHAGASVGITLYPSDAADAAGLLRNADLAMYQAKEQGRSTFRFFASEMTTRAEQFVMLEKDLRLALAREEFVFEFQPVVRLGDGQLAGAEALMRWRHPVRGQVLPGEFIAVAEETRLIVELGAWALRKVCATAAAWCGAGGALARLSFNVSGRQLATGFDQHYVRRVLDESGFPPECLIFEMTESLLIGHDTHVVGVLKAFRDLGIGIAIDDFGTGYSALGYLRRFPVTMLKIDRSFIADVETTDSHLVEAIVALGRGLGLAVVAEGVESARQADILAAMGCELAQGFHFSRPLPAAAFAAWYGQGRARAGG